MSIGPDTWSGSRRVALYEEGLYEPDVHKGRKSGAFGNSLKESTEDVGRMLAILQYMLVTMRRCLVVMQLCF